MVALKSGVKKTFGNRCITIKTKKEMKKNLFMVAAVALMALVSCNKEEINNNVVEQPQEPSYYVEFVASIAEDADTKAFDAATPKTYWVEGEAISINGKKFEVKEVLENGNAIFENKEELGEGFEAPYSAIYPYSAGTSFDAVTVPSEQTAVAENIAPEALVAVAQSENNSLNFKHLTSLLKFQVPAACSEVTISSSNALSGSVKVTSVSDKDIAYSDASASNSLKITGSFEAGKDYYLSVLPGTKSNFVVRIDGYLSKNAESVKISRSKIVNMKKLPAAEISDWGIAGAVNGWSTDSPLTMYKDLNDCVLIRNFSGGAFKFVKNNTWDISRGIRSRDASSPAKGKWNLCGTKDISLSNGAYDVYFSPKDGVFNYVDKGNNVGTYAPSGKAIYLQVKDWSAADAYFEAWVWGSSQADAWYKFAMAGEKDNNHYVIYVPNDATGMKILRKNPTTASGNWTSWNDSGDQSIPSGKNMFIENGWGAYSWGSYSE